MVSSSCYRNVRKMPQIFAIIARHICVTLGLCFHVPSLLPTSTPTHTHTHPHTPSTLTYHTPSTLTHPTPSTHHLYSPTTHHPTHQLHSPTHQLHSPTHHPHSPTHYAIPPHTPSLHTSTIHTYHLHSPAHHLHSPTHTMQPLPHTPSSHMSTIRTHTRTHAYTYTEAEWTLAQRAQFKELCKKRLSLVSANVALSSMCNKYIKNMYVSSRILLP